MPQHFILMVMGGVFTVLGIAALFWGKSEEKKYYDSLATRTDIREYMEHEPQRLGLGALKVGGWIAITIGLLMLAMGGGFWFWG